MELSSDDIRRLEGAGYHRNQFSVLNNYEIRLMNVDGWCYFYSLDKRKCRVYGKRPLGCRLYPVVYSDDKGVMVDKLCPMGHTVSKRESRTKGSVLRKLLRKIDEERRYAMLNCQHKSVQMRTEQMKASGGMNNGTS
jgi:uncharacterized protein